MERVSQEREPQERAGAGPGIRRAGRIVNERKTFSDSKRMAFLEQRDRREDKGQGGGGFDLVGTDSAR